MYYALHLNVQSRTIELGFSWEINAFDICTVRFSQKPFRRNSIYCSFHLHQKACSPFLQCIYALRVYLCTIWKLKRCSSSKRHDKEQDERTLLNKCITAINGHIYIWITYNKVNDYLQSEQYEIPIFIRSLWIQVNTTWIELFIVTIMHIVKYSNNNHHNSGRFCSLYIFQCIP